MGFHHIKPGDTVIRILAGRPIPRKVTAVDESASSRSITRTTSATNSSPWSPPKRGRTTPAAPPTAQAIKASIGKPWPTIVAESVDRGRNIQQTRVAAERSEPGLHLDDRYLYYSLRRVALEIGEDFWTSPTTSTTSDAGR